MTNRDDFSAATKNVLALRAGYCCSFCGEPTVGPGKESSSSVVRNGVAAHISAAAPGGARYLPTMTSAERSGIDNAIWMCPNHGSLIDRDTATYTIEALQKMKRDHETERSERLRGVASPSSSSPADLIAIGPNLICIGEIVGGDGPQWRIHVRDFVIGELATFIGFIDSFAQSDPNDRYILVNALGDGREIAAPPSWTKSEGGLSFQCQVGPRAKRIPVDCFGSQTAVSPDTGDVFIQNGQIAWVSGLESFSQSVQSSLSLLKGEAFTDLDAGASFADYFQAFKDSPWLEQIFKLEVIRHCSIPHQGRFSKEASTRLKCVDRVLRVEVLNRVPTDDRIETQVEFDVRGTGRWTKKVSILVPPMERVNAARGRAKAANRLTLSPVAVPAPVELGPAELLKFRGDFTKK
jgi:hypothetical protein